MKTNNRELMAVHFAVLLFGTAGLFGKFLELSPSIIVWARVAFASLALLVFYVIMNKKYSLTGLKGYSLLLLSGGILAIHWVTFFHSIQVSTVAVGLLSFSTFPVFVVLLEPILFKERLSFKHLLLTIICFVGIRLIIPEFDLQNNVLQGVLWGVLSGLLFAFLTLLNRKLVLQLQAGKIAMFQNLFAFLVLTPFTIGGLKQITTLREVLLLILLGVVFTALSHTLFIYGLRKITAINTSIIACLEPVYGIVFAFLLLREIPSVRTVVGGLLILCSVFYLSITLQHNKENSVEVVYE